MGALDYTTFVDLLKFRAGNNAALSAVVPNTATYDLYGIWINSAYRQLCTQDKILGLAKKLHFPQLYTSTTKTTTDGTAYVTVPTDCLYIEDIFDSTNKRNLDWIPWSQYVDYTDRADTSAEGDPTKWVRHGSNIYLYPTPGTTGDSLTVYYKKLVTDLSGTQTTDIGAEWDDAIVALAAAKMFSWIHEPEKAKVAKEEFLEIAIGLADAYNVEEKDSDITLGPSLAYLGK